MKIEAVPVKVKREIYDRLKEYSEKTKVPAARVIEEALSVWLDTEGKKRLAILSK
jgi:hypothetical protein